MRARTWAAPAERHFAEMFLQAPLPDYVREGAAADPESFELKALALKSFVLKLWL
jgi:hypothetical protein